MTTILAQLTALKTAPMGALRRKWRDLFEREPPLYNRRYLESRLAYRIQELAYGGLKPETIERLEALADELEGKGGRRRRSIESRPIHLGRTRNLQQRLRGHITANHYTVTQIERVKAMPVRFVEVADPVHQYLVELYAHLEYGLPLDEFDTR